MAIINYDIPEGTVTISFEDYERMVRENSQYAALRDNGLEDWPRYQEIMDNWVTSEKFGMDELNIAAFRILRSPDSSDRMLSVASEWLYRNIPPRGGIAEWCAIMRDLEDQLHRYIEGEID